MKRIKAKVCLELALGFRLRRVAGVTFIGKERADLGLEEIGVLLLR